jgi:hypothetical protein
MDLGRSANNYLFRQPISYSLVSLFVQRTCKDNQNVCFFLNFLLYPIRFFTLVLNLQKYWWP